jgi:hypothetical protein
MLEEINEIKEWANKIRPAGRSSFTKQEFKDTIVSTPGKPRIIAGNCEFCGIEATKCSHYGEK